MLQARRVRPRLQRLASVLQAASSSLLAVTRLALRRKVATRQPQQEWANIRAERYWHFCQAERVGRRREQSVQCAVSDR